MNKKYKVERKPARIEAVYYEVMLSPFGTLKEAEQYIDKYQCFYPIDERNYKITEIVD